MDETYDVQHWAGMAFERAFSRWQDDLPEDSEIQYLDYLERMDAFFAANPNGWPPHPDDPQAARIQEPQP